MDFLAKCNIDVRHGDSEAHARVALAVPPKGPALGSFEMDGHVREVVLTLGSGKVYDVEVITLLPIDTFQGIPLSMPPEDFVDKLRSEGFKVEFDTQTIEIVSSSMGFYVSEDQIATVGWSLSRE